MVTVWKPQEGNYPLSSMPGVTVSTKTTKTEYLLTHQFKTKEKQLERSADIRPTSGGSLKVAGLIPLKMP